MMRTPPERRPSGTFRRGPIGAPSRPPRDTYNERVAFLPESISIWGWPSRGGLIVLEGAGHLDFDYLGLNRFQPITVRAISPNKEDALCKGLLQLGARWFDSRERYGFVANVAAREELDIQAIEDEQQPAPTDMERRWVSVGIEENGFWVLEHDQLMYHVRETDNLLPTDVCRVELAKTMEEKCEVLKSRGAAFYQTLGDYKGLASLNAWESKTTGEFGPLAKDMPTSRYVPPTVGHAERLHMVNNPTMSSLLMGYMQRFLDAMPQKMRELFEYISKL